MALADKLVAIAATQTTSGPTLDRYDYQTNWALAHILKLHNSAQDYAVVFEAFDDVAVLDSETAPTSVSFYQIKTKAKGQWTIERLTNRPKGKGGSPLPSITGKLYQHKINLPSDTKSLNFVSNASCKSLDSSKTEVCFDSLDASNKTIFLANLKAEHPTAQDTDAGIFFFHISDLSLQDHDSHLKGKLHNFLQGHLGSVAYNLEALYLGFNDACRQKSKAKPTVASFSALLTQKAVSRSTIAKWIDELKGHLHSAPSWEETLASLGALDAETLRKFRTAWKEYQLHRLDPGNASAALLSATVRAHLTATTYPNKTLAEVVAAAADALASKTGSYTRSYVEASVAFEFLSS